MKARQNAVILIPPSCLFSEARHVFTVCLQNLQMHVASLRHDSCDQRTEIMTQLSRQQSAGGWQTRIYSPGGAVKARVWQTKKGRASDLGKCSPEWDSRSVLLYWCSLVSGFLSEHSLLSASEMPPSPISRDDSLPLRSRGGAPGAFDNSLITAGAIYPFLIALLWVKGTQVTSHMSVIGLPIYCLRKWSPLTEKYHVKMYGKKHIISSKKTILKTILTNKAVMRCTVKRKAGQFLTEN